MRVRYNYLPEQFDEKARKEIFEKIEEVVKKGDFTLGKAVAEFEYSFARLIQAKYAIGIGSGTDAIKLSLKAIGIGHGDEVITAANTFVATVGAIVELGAIPVFVDVNDNYVMDTNLIAKAITPRTKAIVPVHFTGEPVNMEKFGWEIPVVEDACQSILAGWDGGGDEGNCGTFGATGCFSLHPLKNLNVWSDGGMIVTDEEEIYEKLKLLRNHGLKDRDTVEIFGYNSRLDTIQAIVGNWLLPKAYEITNKRIENAAYYDLHLAKIRGIQLPPKRPQARRVYHLYMFRVHAELRNSLINYLNRFGIEAKIHYPVPIYRQPACLKYTEGQSFPNTDRQALEVVSIPVDQHITKAQQDYVIEKIGDFF